MDKELIKKVVRKSIEEVIALSQNESQNINKIAISDIDDIVYASHQAQSIWSETELEFREKIISELRNVMIEHASEFSKMAVEETGLGNVEDKIKKHINAALATPGTEDLKSVFWNGKHGSVMETYIPYGVVAASTPLTHPVPVLLNNLISLIAAGNSVVFTPHPKASDVSSYAVKIFDTVIRKNGGPKNLVSIIGKPTLDSTKALFYNQKIRLIIATGGPTIVNLAFSAGKKVIAAGPGNPPVLVDETADIEKAVKDIVEGASFDNNILCIAEKEVFISSRVIDDFCNLLPKYSARLIQTNSINKLTETVLIKDKSANLYHPKPEFVGKNATKIGSLIGLNIPSSVKVLFGKVSYNHPFVLTEQMMPFIPIVEIDSFEQGLKYCKLAENNYGHTSILHSKCINNIKRFIKEMNTTITVVNNPSIAGNGPSAGDAYFSHTIASPTGEGVCTAKTFSKVKRIAIDGLYRT